MKEERNRELLRLIALNGYAAWRHALWAAGCEAGRHAWERAQTPQVGDLVLETSTFYARKDYVMSWPGPELGYLLREAWEPFPGEDADPAARERVFYVKPLDRSSEEYRWVNASFIRLEDGTEEGSL